MNRALAEGKSVRISYLLSTIFAFLDFFDFSHCISEFSKYSCMLETFLALFLSFTKIQKYFRA